MRTLVGVVVAACVTVACGGGDDSSGPTSGAIRFVNQTSYPVHELYVAPSADSTWGSVQNDSPIWSYSSFTVTGLSPGYWDAMAVSVGSLSTYFAYAFDEYVDGGDLVELTAVDSHFTGSLKVTNGSGSYSLTGVYLVPSASPTWGANQLSIPIAIGATFHLLDVPPGNYDLRCVHSNGGSSEATYSISSFSARSVTCY
jgi:hypothetical protein